MIAFVTSMRHPDNADDYAYNELLLRQTLDSIAQQTSEDYVVIVVGNRAPAFTLPPRTHFVPVDFVPPKRANGPHADRDGFVRDKGTKIGVALAAARQFSPDWVMIFDADDFVHRSLVEFVDENPGAEGWVIDKGWIYSRARNGYRAQENLHRTCGTSYIIPFDAYRVPESLSLDASQDEVLAAYGDVLPNIMGAHRNAVQWHRDQGRTLRELPFRGAVYHVDTGENHSGKALPGLVRPWSPQWGEAFGVPSTRGRLATLVATCGPVAVGQSAGAAARRVYRALRRRAGRLIRGGEPA